jgi:hypothetical protein
MWFYAIKVTTFPHLTVVPFFGSFSNIRTRKLFPLFRLKLRILVATLLLGKSCNGTTAELGFREVSVDCPFKSLRWAVGSVRIVNAY